MMKELLSRVLVFIFACAIAVAVSFAHAELPTTSEATSVQKANPSSKEILTLKEFLRRVLKNNHEILIKEKELENAKWRERAVWATFFPSVDLTLSKTEALKMDPTTHEDNNGNVVQDPPGPSFLESLGTHTSSLGVSLNLFNGMKDLSSLRASQLKYRQAEASLYETQSKVLRESIISYTRIIAIHKYIQLFQSYKTRRQDNFDIVKLQYAHGKEDQGSVLLCQAYLEYVDVMILRYERILKQTKEDLLEFMGEEVTTSMYVDLNFQLAIEKPFEPTNGFKDLIEKREEYINAVYNELFAHDEVQSAQAEFLPKLDLTATGSSTSSDLDFGHQKDWSLTLNLVLPLFSGGRSYSGLQEKNNQWLIKKIDKEMIYISTKKSLRDAFYKYDEAFVEYGISQTIIKARRLKTAITRERYRAGLSKFDSWDNAETDLFKEEYNLIAYYREALIAQVEWWHLSGKGFDHLWK